MLLCDVSNASTQYFICDGLVNKTNCNKPVDVLGNIVTNADVNCENVNCSCLSTYYDGINLCTVDVIPPSVL